MSLVQPESTSIATRERLLDVAEVLFADRGFDATSVRDLTAAADCNVAAVSYHFGSKESLYREAFRRRITALREHRLASIRLALAHPASATLESILAAFAAAYVGPLVDGGSGNRFIRMVSRELLDPHVPPGMLIDEMMAPVQDALAAALVAACPGLTRPAADGCVQCVVGQLFHAVKLQRCLARIPDSHAAFDLPARVDHIVRFSCAGIRAMAG